MTAGLLFVVSLAIIVAASELFTNAVEWAGYRLHLGSGATGSLLAALGTAMPETIVPVVAILGGGAAANDVALGAILGAPFLLLTAGAGVTGVAVTMRRRARSLELDRGQVRRDLGTFLLCAAVLAVCLVLPQTARRVVAILLAGVYAAYVVTTLRSGVPDEDIPSPLHLLRWRGRGGVEPAAAIAVQLVASVGLLILGAELVVDALDRAATVVHIPTLLLALVLVPLATELPETMNSVIWIRSRDDGLAFGNVAGASVFQVSVLGAVGIAFTTWRPSHSALISSAVTVVCAAYLLVVLRNGRARGPAVAAVGLAWIAFAAGVAVSAAAGGA